VAIGLAVARRYPPTVGLRGSLNASRLLWSALSLLPDADVIGFGLEVRYSDEWGHRGATHSLVFGAALGAVIGLLAPVVGASRVRTGVLAAAVLISHPLLDMLTTGGLGCALFWPFDLTRHFAPWRPIPVAPIGAAFVSARGVFVAVVEVILFLPLLLYAVWPRQQVRE
jgi:inner membrane protein